MNEIGAAMVDVKWDIRRDGRSWVAGEALPRYDLTPEKIEMVRGKLFNNDEERIVMLGLLLENLGADALVKLGNPQVCRDAVKLLHL